MKSRKQIIKGVVKEFGFFPIFVEIYRVIMKSVALIFNFCLTLSGVMQWKLGYIWSAVCLIGGSACIFLFVLKDHSEDRIYEWSVKTYHSAEHLLMTTAVLYLFVIIVQFLLLFLPKIINI
ncbi:MAG: hypothetical protein IKJ13_03315 [Clostridia bacterium]|nr:hypothetical protein [Clostridia bacterium]